MYIWVCSAVVPTASAVHLVQNAPHQNWVNFPTGWNPENVAALRWSDKRPTIWICHALREPLLIICGQPTPLADINCENISTIHQVGCLYKRRQHWSTVQQFIRTCNQFYKNQEASISVDKLVWIGLPHFNGKFFTRYTLNHNQGTEQQPIYALYSLNISITIFKYYNLI